jgi:hypothetical protein
MAHRNQYPDTLTLGLDLQVARPRLNAFAGLLAPVLPQFIPD